MIGHALGPYRVLEQIGAGAMGVVFRARDTRLDRDVALKVLPASAIGDDSARRRLLQEAKTASALNHPNICAIYDVGEADGQVYIAMELVQGRLLTADLGRDPSALPRVLRLGVQLADALEHAHDRGIIHRDLKPSNIMVTPQGDAKILDFGVASRTAAAGADQTRSAATLEADARTTAGTLSYLAPELLQGGVPDGRADIWAFGIVLYELMTGHRPFEGATSFEVSSAILRDPTPALPAGVPAALRGVVMKCLEKDPARRYQRAGEVRAGLETAQSAWSERGTTPPSTALGAGPTRVGTTRRNAVLVGIGLLVLTAAVIAFSWRGLRPSTSSAAVPRVESIAVLPLANLSGDPAQEYFADGMTEALIADLAKISSLKVISRTSVMRYRGTTRPLPEIARELGVDAVIEGSVQRSKDRIRITAQLIDAASDRHLWADSYDRSSQDVLALQSEVARAIATQVRARVSPEETARLQNARTVKPEAYEAYLLGLHHIARRNPESLERAFESFQKATELDPTFALGWAGLSGAYIERDVWGDSAWVGTPTPRGRQRSRPSGSSRTSPTRTARSRPSSSSTDWDWPGTEASYLKAIELNPSLADAYSGYAYYLTAMGRFDESIANARRAAELDPLSPVLVGSYGRALYRARRYEDALARYKRALEIDPEDRPSLSRIAEAYIELGKYQEALSFADRLEKIGLAPARLRGRIYAAMGRTSEALAEIERIKRDSTAGDQAVAYAAIYAQLGRADEAIAALEQGVEAHFRREPGAMLPFVPMDPVFDPIRGHPRFNAMLERAKLPRYTISR